MLLANSEIDRTDNFFTESDLQTFVRPPVKVKPGARSEQEFFDLAERVYSLITEPLLPDVIVDQLERQIVHVITSGNKDSNNFTTKAFAKGLRRDWNHRIKLSSDAREQATNQRILAEAITTILTRCFRCSHVIREALQKALNDVFNDLPIDAKKGMGHVEEKFGENSIEYYQALLAAEFAQNG